MVSGAVGNFNLTQLYRSARTLSGDAFADALFGWLRSTTAFDLGAVITSFPDRPGYMDARFIRRARLLDNDVTDRRG